MRIAFEFMFYIMINLVPGKVDQFQATFDKEGQEVVMNFVRLPANHWKLTAGIEGRTKSETAEFWFDDDLANYYKKDRVGIKKIPFARKVDIKRNHKKWRKVSNIRYIAKYADETPKPSVAFEIKKKTKKKYRIKPIGKDAESRSFPDVQIMWK